MAAAEKRLRLHLVTWNVGTASPPPDIASLLLLDSENPRVDLYVVGLQEVNSGIRHLLSDLAFDDPWTLFLVAALSPLGYVKVAAVRMQGLLLLLFVKQAHLPFVRRVRSQSTRTGLHGYWGNKGGISTCVSLYGHMVCFLNCHLPAHQENTRQRLEDFGYILEMQQFEKKQLSQVPGLEILFWFGDLNFRIEDYGCHFIQESISSNRLDLLWEKDQLNIAKKKDPFLQEFLEGPLKFKPTYKFDRHSVEYDTSEKKRKPAWTDRILWRQKRCLRSESKEAAEGLVVSVSLQSYTSHMSYKISDHRPVSGTFELKLIPLGSDPLVLLHPVGTWTAEQDATISYTTAPEFTSSVWDWIGLYKVTFRDAKDYVMYAWVHDNEISSREGDKQVYLGAEGFPRVGGEFVLGYYSHALQSIVGLSQPVQIQPSQRGGHGPMSWENSTSCVGCERPPCDF